jgi:hypothetical protein
MVFIFSFFHLALKVHYFIGYACCEADEACPGAAAPPRTAPW